MRRRILRTTLGATLSLIAVMTALMLWGDWLGTGATYQRRIDADLEYVAQQLHGAFHDNRESLTAEQVEAVLPTGRRVEIDFSDGSYLSVGEGGGAPTAELIIEDLGSIRLVDTTGGLAQAQVVASVTIVGIGLLLAAVSVVVMRRLADRLTTPFDDLLAHAERLQTGDLRLLDRHYDIDEFDRLVVALNTSVARVQTLLAEERRLTIDASHQLKTPLTALSLRLEELTEVRPDASRRAEALLALEQVERLSSVVDDLLVERRTPGVRREQVALETVVDQQCAEWGHLFAAQGRELVADALLREPCPVDSGPVGQVVATLLENSLQHGAGTTRLVARDPHGTPWIEVSDDGPGVSDDIAAEVFEREVSGGGGTGLGLAAAQDAAVSMGGRLALVRRRPAHFRLYLSLREDPPPVGPEPEERAERQPDDVGGDVVGER